MLEIESYRTGNKLDKGVHMGHSAQNLLTARVQLRDLLRERNSLYTTQADEIDRLIRQEFERTVAVLVLDMCGFTRTARRYGVIHYLAMIAQMDELARPAIEDNGGTVVKQEADNVFAYFPTPYQAVESAKDILRSFGAANIALPDERHIHGCMGIGYGPTLVIGNEDMFGNEMNLACKLGEDIASKSEILLTENAYNALPSGLYQVTPLQFGISGVDFRSYRLE
jgi:adenylate cyclase